MKLASVVLYVEIAELFVLMFEALVEMLEALDAMSVSLEVMLVVLALILDSTLESEPSVKVPSMSASFLMVTAPEVCPSSRSPVEKSPYNKLLEVEVSPPAALTHTLNI